MLRHTLAHFALLSGSLACILFVGDGCQTKQQIFTCTGPCCTPTPEPTCPAPADPEEATEAEGTTGVSGYASLDTATGNTNVYLVPVGEGTPPAQLCNNAGCAALANGVTGAPIVDVITLPPVNAELPAPSIGSVAYATATSVYIVDMVRRSSTALPITFTSPITGVALGHDGKSMLVTAGNVVTRVNLGTQRAEATYTFRGNDLPTSVCDGIQDDEDDTVYTCGSGGCSYIQNDTLTPLAEISGGDLSCNAERGYVANAQGVELFHLESGEKITTYPLANASRCHASDEGDSVYCTARDGANTVVVGFNTIEDSEFKRITIPGTNTFITGSITGRTVLIGQQNGSTGAILTCDRQLNCTSRSHNLNRSATLVPFTQ